MRDCKWHPSKLSGRPSSMSGTHAAKRLHEEKGVK